MAGGLPHPVLFADMVLEAVGTDLGAMQAQNPELLAQLHLIIYTWTAMAFLFVLGFLLRQRLEVIPGKLQNVLEVVVGGLEDFVVANMGEKGRQVFPLLCTLFIFILTMNLMGLVPGCDAPTANLNTNVGMALFVFVYYNYWGIRTWKFKYIKHFLGPIPVMIPLMLPVEILSHLSRPLSLSVRLFGNIRGEEIVLIILFVLAPLFGTFPMHFLFIFIKVVQAFVFFMLSMVYLKLAMEPAH
jgi:F-type H+-transporting ATPase subunit a